jgi:two-component system OmpR family sensor kinase
MLFLGVTAVSVSAYLAVSSGLEADIDRQLLRETEAFSAAIASVDTTSLPETARTYLQNRSISTGDQRPVLVVKLADGRVISNSDIRIEEAQGPDMPAMGFTTVRVDGIAYRVANTPLLDTEGTPIAVFEAGLALAYASAVAAELAWTLALSGLVVIAVGASLSVWVARVTLSPLRDVARTTGEVTQASLGERIAYDGPDDEVGAMVRSVNGMLGRLEAAFADQRHFIADASHELRTPLAVVSGNLELLEHPRVSAESRDAAMRAMRRELTRMERMVNDLLALSRIESGAALARQPLQVAALLKEARGRTLAMGDRTVTVDADDDLWVSGDPELLDQALGNIVRNAVTHTPENGSINLRAWPVGAAVLISVTDTGPGIREQDVDRVFDRFWRAQGKRSDVSGGSGLGLAITKRLLDLHDGSITARNRTDATGAVFTITLPRIDVP